MAAKRPEQTGRWLIGGAPNVVAGQADVLPSKRRDVAQQVRIDRLPLAGQVGKRYLQIFGVPKDDGRNQQVEPRCPEELVLKRAVTNFAEATKVDRAGERIAGFTFVEPKIGAAAQIRGLDPVEREQCPLDPANLAQCLGESILSGVSGKLFQDRRGRGGARSIAGALYLGGTALVPQNTSNAANMETSNFGFLVVARKCQATFQCRTDRSGRDASPFAPHFGKDRQRCISIAFDFP